MTERADGKKKEAVMQDHVTSGDLERGSRVVYRSHQNGIGYSARVVRVLRAAAEVYVDDERWNSNNRSATIRFNKLFLDRSGAEARAEAREREVAAVAPGVVKRAAPSHVKAVPPPAPEPEPVKSDVYDTSDVDAWLEMGRGMVHTIDNAIEGEMLHIAAIEDQIAALEAERDAASEKLGSLRRKKELLSKLTE